MLAESDTPFQRSAIPLNLTTTFEIFQNQCGRWYALRADGMVLGIFFRREDAIRFARHECDGTAPLTLITEGAYDAALPAQRAA